MKAEMILDRIEFNIIPWPFSQNNEPKAARFHLTKEKKNNIIMTKFLKKINNEYGNTIVKEYFSETEKNQFGQPLIVQIGNEQWNYKIPSYVLNLKDIVFANNKKEANSIIEAQSLIFKIQGGFDKYITFKFKRDWINSQGQLEEGSRKFYNIISNKLLNNNFKINAEIKKDKKSGYYIISKII